ncbi:hypothetical protein [Spirosoma oryzicola]|uniref:hypothetical protein n=1 Tax=Spirosoma oryzicola TaxID=2898794 RepID=UPI001E2FA857|nr:hypothetical protein [Spirosoma oryzicola]UHG93450.1 hypothetical protein LQ777_11210 [Spirosoma oryzicola]
MSEIARSGKWNPGGGRWLDVVAAVGVEPTQVPGAITFKAGFDWTRIYCTQGTLQYRMGSQHTDNGRLYSFEIKGFSPDDNAVKSAAIDALFAYEKLIVRFTDNSGLVRIVGLPDEALTFSHELGTDPDVPGQRGYDLNLKGTSTQRSAYA